MEGGRKRERERKKNISGRLQDVKLFGKGGWGPEERERELSNKGRIYILSENIH